MFCANLTLSLLNCLIWESHGLKKCPCNMHKIAHRHGTQCKPCLHEILCTLPRCFMSPWLSQIANEINCAFFHTINCVKLFDLGELRAQKASKQCAQKCAQAWHKAQTVPFPGGMAAAFAVPRVKWIWPTLAESMIAKRVSHTAIPTGERRWRR